MNNPKPPLYRNVSKTTSRRAFHPPLTAGSSVHTEDFYKELIDEIAEGIISLDLSGIILFANIAACKMLDASSAQIVGRHFTDFIDKHSVDKSLENFIFVKSGKTIMQQVITIRDRNNRPFPVEFSASPNIENGRVVQIHAIFRNVAERKEMEALVLESEKMNAIQHFIAGTAQEIRNPLKGLSDKLEKILYDYERRDFEYIGFKEFKNLFEMIRNMRDEARYCFETTQRLLDISKRKIGKDELYCQMNTVIKEVAARLQSDAPESAIQIQFKLSRALPDVKIGAIELSQVIVHLLRNAIQSIAHEGEVTFKTSYQVKDETVTMECIDNGVGISKENLPKIFEPFYTTKPRNLGGGGGLGLSIVYAIVKRHQGDIRVKSNLRDGTRVILRFPARKKKN